MKLGPCFRNSVVSPKRGQPILPGGKLLSFLYLTSFHLNRAMQKQSPKNTTPRTTMHKAIFCCSQEVVKGNPLQGELEMVWALLCFNYSQACVYIYRPERERERERGHIRQTSMHSARGGALVFNPRSNKSTFRQINVFNFFYTASLRLNFWIIQCILIILSLILIN